MRYFLDSLFSGSRWYRRRSGGHWYYVKDASLSGFSSDEIGWVREVKGSLQVIKEEHYSAKESGRKKGQMQVRP